MASTTPPRMKSSYLPRWPILCRAQCWRRAAIGKRATGRDSRGAPLARTLAVAFAVSALAFAWAAALGEEEAEMRKPAMAILRLEPKGQVEKFVTDALDDFLNAQIFATKAYDLVNRDKIDEVMKELKLQKTDVCDSTKCFAEIGGAVGADKLLAGSIALLGETYIITLKVIDITEIKEDLVASRTCRCSLDDLTGKMRELVAQVTLAGAGGLGTGENPQTAYSNKGSPIKEITGRDGAPMVLVPAGEFLMGCPSSDAAARENERPQRRIYLSSFYIDKYEITYDQFKIFLEATKDSPHGEGCHEKERFHPGKPDHKPYYLGSGTVDGPGQPVIGITWFDAYAYCGWAGRRLPSEAEWEKAARGPDGRLYPWGDELPGEFDQGNFADESYKASGGGEPVVTDYEDGFVLSAPVGSFPRGASPYGALDMAGNVAELTLDLYLDDYHEGMIIRNPVNLTTWSGTGHTIRGGSHRSDPHHLRTSARIYGDGDGPWDGVGFRCAMDDPAAPKEEAPDSEK